MKIDKNITALSEFSKIKREGVGMVEVGNIKDGERTIKVQFEIGKGDLEMSETLADYVLLEFIKGKKTRGASDKIRKMLEDGESVGEVVTLPLGDYLKLPKVTESAEAKALRLLREQRIEKVLKKVETLTDVDDLFIWTEMVADRFNSDIFAEMGELEMQHDEAETNDELESLQAKIAEWFIVSQDEYNANNDLLG